MANDASNFFASERTLLAWVRTGLATIGIGFVVERFGLFMRVFAGHEGIAQNAGSAHGSAVLGVLLVVFGSLAIVIGMLQHRSYLHSLPPQNRPAGYPVRWAVGFAAAAALLGFALAIYLVL